ncbi:DUF2264 domain-containing protein [Paramicrobacterium sp. CJ85]|uniref:DUF2264 domain-containing protein n=1 Tax=Paramicrobacterium sp. CJ85 TaxID=3445355 RepID=UPI003F641072
MTSPRGILPTDDWTLSPHTGYTREHWVNVADRILDAAHARSLRGGSRVAYHPDSNEVDQLEGFARTFLLAAVRIAGDPDECGALAERYLEAFARAAHDPWPQLTHHSQPTVEAAAIAIGLHLTRPWLWQRFDPAVREYVCEWFEQARGHWCADNNHVLLGATLAAFNESVGYSTAGSAVDAALDRIEDWYLGDGWYTDGDGRRIDHYNAWTFHLYPFMIARMLGEQMDARRALYRRRLAEFLESYQHVVGADGAPVLFGRSLIYRWGIAAPFWMARLEGVEALSPGRTRRLCSGVLRYFIDRGVAADGTLSLGWSAEQHPPLVQSYSGPGSPHWASKGFLGLLLPATDPVWAGREEPLELEQRDVTHVLTGARLLVTGRQRDGIARVHNFGTDGHPLNDDGLYRRLVFTSATAPVLDDEPRDSTVTVPGARQRCIVRSRVTTTGGALVRVLDAGGRHVTVETWLTLGRDENSAAAADADADADTELRVARMRGVIGLPIEVSGYALAVADAGASQLRIAENAGAVTRVEETRANLTSSLEWLGSWSLDDVPAGPCALDLAPVASVARPRSGTALGDIAAFPIVTTAASSSNDVVIVWRSRLSADAPLATAQPPTPALEKPRVHLLSVIDDRVDIEIDELHLTLRSPGGQEFVQDALGQGVFRP